MYLILKQNNKNERLEINTKNILNLLINKNNLYISHSNKEIYDIICHENKTFWFLKTKGNYLELN